MSRELRIVGPPGTGKTTTLSRRVEATVRERGADCILIASLTRAAAREIAGRVDLPKHAVGTLHAHAFRALERPELAETPEGVKAWNAHALSIGEAYMLKARKRAVDLDDAAGEALAPSMTGDGRLAAYSTARARCTPRELWDPTVRAFADHWEAWKRESGRLDFNDLIEQAIADVPVAPGSPSVLLLDEAQDFSRLDMRLARQWGAGCDVFVVVGDEKQALFDWRGGDPEVFGEGDADVQILDRSYRVPAAVHAYATGWLAHHGQPLTAAYRPRLDEHGVEAPGVVRRDTHTWRSPGRLAGELEEHLKADRRVMVLAACGYMLYPLIDTLRERGVPFGNPYRANEGRLNPLAGAGRVRAYLRAFADPPQEWTWEHVRAWAEPLRAAGVFERGAKALIESKCSTRARFAEREPGDQVADYETVTGLLAGEARLHLGLGDLHFYERSLLPAFARRLAYPLAVARAGGRLTGPAMSGPGIIVSTVHGCKGGEADVVYVFPDLSRAGFDGWLLPGPRHDAVARQFYVAFTRARDELVLCEPSSAHTVAFPRIESEASR